MDLSGPSIDVKLKERKERKKDTLNHIEFLSFCFGEPKDESQSLIWSMSVSFIYDLVGYQFLSVSHFLSVSNSCHLASEENR